jgi:hypothetical protein
VHTPSVVPSAATLTPSIPKPSPASSPPWRLLPQRPRVPLPPSPPRRSLLLRRDLRRPRPQGTSPLHPGGLR